MTNKRSPWPEYAKTLPSMFYERAAKWGDSPLFRYKKAGFWTDIKWSEAEQKILEIASGLMAEGFAPRSAVAILSGNRPEWALADFGAMSAAIMNVPIYPTNTAEQIAYILEDSGAEGIFVENEAQLKKILSVRSQLPKLRRAIVIEPYTKADEFVTDLPTLMAKGREKLDRKAIEARWKAVDPEDVCSLIYTSGTTGNPKGVMLCHRNLVSNLVGVGHVLSVREGEKDLQFLPMCHVFGRLEVLGGMMNHALICFAESIEKISDNFKEIQPDMFITVPRLLEKVHAKITAGVDTGPPLKKKLFNWAIGVGKQRTQFVMNKQPVPLVVAIQFAIASKLVFSKIKAALGGRIRVLVYGAAPLATEIQEFFAATGIIALEAFGLTETSPGLTANKPDGFRLGTIGKPWKDTQVIVAPDGEILAKGPQIMLGYWNKPEATAEAMEGGWFHTGDVGVIDQDGFIKITDRKKDIIVTSGGKNVAPQNIENLLKMDEAIEQVAVIGDRRQYLVALIVPNAEWLKMFAQEKGLTGNNAELVKKPEVKAEIERRIAKKNEHLAKYETIKKFELLAEEFSVENNMLTPTLKVRRKNVMAGYKNVIDAMYPPE